MSALAVRALDVAANPAAPDVPALLRTAHAALGDMTAEAVGALRARVAPAGRVEGPRLDAAQRAAHGLAWLATAAETLRALDAELSALRDAGETTALEESLSLVAAAELAAQALYGLPMGPNEIVRPHEMGLSPRALERARAALAGLIERGTAPQARAALVDALREGSADGLFGRFLLDDTLDAIRGEMRRVVLAEVAPHAHAWHRENAYIPLPVVEKLAELGVFGLTIPEAFGGLGLSKVAMCVVSEELSRGYIGVGSLGTRSEIAAELILAGGTEAQKAHWLPKLASGETLPTAVFTEPDTGSDLASLRTRAVRDGDDWVVNGNKTWITHPVRADLMTMLVRTSAEPGHRGLSLLLAEKGRGTDDEPFPVAGLTGGEIAVLGYRGMKEYELAFDGFRVKPAQGAEGPVPALLGAVEGQGFKHLMRTFEAARIQTAARAVGVAQSALDLGLSYAKARVQFGRPILEFPRVGDKLALIAASLHAARALTFAAARAKDADRRCDLEAGMAKLYAARVAWNAADDALQIHGGNGFALEYEISRVLCDARILSIFEGAAEIQAQVIARRLLEG